MKTSKVTYELIELLELKRLKEKLKEVQKQVKELQSKLDQQKVNWEFYESVVTPLTKIELNLMTELFKRSK